MGDKVEVEILVAALSDLENQLLYEGYNFAANYLRNDINYLKSIIENANENSKEIWEQVEIPML